MKDRFKRRRPVEQTDSGQNQRVGLVGCVKSKGPRPARAAELYTSSLFQGRRSFVERTCDRWFVLSAEHGLVRSDQVIEPYDVSLRDEPAARRRQWSSHVLDQLERELRSIAGLTFEVHAGIAYRNFGLVDGLRRAGARVEVPAEHLTQGEQLAFYADPASAHMPNVERLASKGVRAAPREVSPSGPGPSGSYRALYDYLLGQHETQIAMTFAEVEALLGRSLPSSARKHRPWWANSGQPHSRAWVEAGWLASSVDLRNERLTFRRRDG